MRRQHTGRPGTVVVPAGWDTAAADVVDHTHHTAVTIRPTGGHPEWNEERGQSETVGAEPTYEGPATLMLASPDQAAVVVEQDTSIAVYEVKLRWASAAVQVGHLIHVTESADPMLTGQTLTVAAVERGDRRFSRVLLATFTPPPGPDPAAA